MTPYLPSLAAALALGACGVAAPALAQPKTQAAPAVDPAAIQAVARMSAYLRTVPQFELTTEATREEVINDAGDKLSFDSANTYRVRRPDAFFVETRSDSQLRRFYYDGRSFTVALPNKDFYAQVSAPPTISGVLEAVYTDFGVALPLADVFYWGVKDPPPGVIQSAARVGRAKIAGVDTDHYAFRSKDLAWQLWIQRGDQPLPRKVVITTLDDPAKPAYSATLTWNLKPRFAANTFSYSPTTAARPIALAKIGQ